MYVSNMNLCMYSLALRLGQATFWEAYINALEVPGVISETTPPYLDAHNY